MADGENILVTACSSASDMDEPAAKKPKIPIATKCGLKVTQTEQISCEPETAGSWEAMANSAQPVETEVEPVMAVQQAPAAIGGDNGLGLLNPEPHKRVVKLTIDEAPLFGTAEEAAGNFT